MALVVEPIEKMVCSLTGSRLSELPNAVPFLEDRLPVLDDRHRQSDRTPVLGGLGGVGLECGDLGISLGRDDRGDEQR
jgi:hypothetical protein